MGKVAIPHVERADQSRVEWSPLSPGVPPKANAQVVQRLGNARTGDLRVVRQMARDPFVLPQHPCFGKPFGISVAMREAPRKRRQRFLDLPTEQGGAHELFAGLESEANVACEIRQPDHFLENGNACQFRKGKALREEPSIIPADFTQAPGLRGAPMAASINDVRPCVNVFISREESG